MRLIVILTILFPLVSMQPLTASAEANKDSKLLQQAKAWAQKNNKGTVDNQKTAAIGDDGVSGTVEVSSGIAKSIPGSGVLFVYARQFGIKAGPPAAVVRIPNPKFPQSFRLTKQDVMMPGMSFSGPFTLTAKFSPEGDAMQKSGAFIGHSSEKKKIALGESDLKIVINNAL